MTKDQHAQITELQAQVAVLTRSRERLRDALKSMRGCVNEGGVPRYTVTPGAALNTVVTYVDDVLSQEPV